MKALLGTFQDVRGRHFPILCEAENFDDEGTLRMKIKEKKHSLLRLLEGAAHCSPGKFVPN